MTGALVHHTFDLSSELKLALHNKLLEVLYQPQINTKTSTIIGLEALLRWNHHTYGDIAPSTFVPIGEKEGLMDEISLYVLEVICEDIFRWTNENIEIPTVHMNISASQFKGPQFFNQIIPLIKEKGLKPGQIGLEITESVKWNGESIKSLLPLHTLGIRFSIDDFGEGYTGFKAIKSFPFDAIKIDRQYITNLSRNSKDLAIVSSIIHLAQKLKVRIVAEGVEDKQTLSLLEKMDCFDIQGFYFSKPLTNRNIPPFLNEWKKTN